MGGVWGGVGHVGEARGRGALEAHSCPFESISGLHSPFPCQVCRDHFESGAFSQHSTTGGFFVSGRQTQGDMEAVGSPVCPSAPLLVRHFARVAFVGIQAGWYNRGAVLGSWCCSVDECVGLQVPGGAAQPAFWVLWRPGRSQDCLQSFRRQWPLKAVGILCVSSFLRNRKGFF